MAETLTAPTAGGARTTAVVLAAEVRKGLANQFAHPLGHVVTLAVSVMMYLGLQYVMGQGQLREDLLPATLIAIGAYWFLQYSGQVMVADLIEEKRSGTFAGALMSPAPPWVPMLGRLATAAIFALPIAALASLVPALVVGIGLPWRWQALAPYAVLAANILAFTFVMAAVAIRSPAIGALHSLLTSLVLMLNGAFMPLSLYPDWLAFTARLLPTTLAIEAITETLFDGASAASMRNGGALPLAAAHTAALIALGAWVLRRNVRLALAEGRTGRY
jgi:ABC-2 type transport system permease protein